MKFCPKCKSKMYEVTEISSGSTLNRYNSSSSIIQGWKCPPTGCSTFIPLPVEIVKAMPKRNNKKSAEYEMNEYDMLVWRYKDSILRMLEEKANMTSIVSLVRRALPGCKATHRCLHLAINRLQKGILHD